MLSSNIVYDGKNTSNPLGTRRVKFTMVFPSSSKYSSVERKL